MLSAKETSTDFMKSLDIAIEKVASQLKKYKAKLRAKDKVAVRTRIREKA
jgi:ribosome-associated translation inhibitor RaiA